VTRLDRLTDAGRSTAADRDDVPADPTLRRSRRERLLGHRSPRTVRLVRVAANLVGAAGAAWFAWAGWRHFASTHSLVGAGFFVAQLWVVVAYLVRRPASVVSERTTDWLLAFGGTFGGVLLRPYGAHPHWGDTAGLVLQVVGLVAWTASFVSLGRSFGFAPADRGVKRRGTYAVVRHPVYASYVLLLLGYVLQNQSIRNVLVMVFVIACDVGRALAEERLLASSSAYMDYRATVRWRLVPGIW
jgi:protein-S-isoprenylcysteine O-methyltransferase Ste14